MAAPFECDEAMESAMPWDTLTVSYNASGSYNSDNGSGTTEVQTFTCAGTKTFNRARFNPSSPPSAGEFYAVQQGCCCACKWYLLFNSTDYGVGGIIFTGTFTDTITISPGPPDITTISENVSVFIPFEANNIAASMVTYTPWPCVKARGDILPQTAPADIALAMGGGSFEFEDGSDQPGQDGSNVTVTLDYTGIDEPETGSFSYYANGFRAIAGGDLLVPFSPCDGTQSITADQKVNGSWSSGSYHSSLETEINLLIELSGSNGGFRGQYGPQSTSTDKVLGDNQGLIDSGGLTDNGGLNDNGGIQDSSGLTDNGGLN